MFFGVLQICCLSKKDFFKQKIDMVNSSIFFFKIHKNRKIIFPKIYKNSNKNSLIMHLHHSLRKQLLKHRVQNKHYFPDEDNKIVVETSNLM
jgi:hypothetical protein